ncbi:MAG: UTP--glucose-1-phosphate uridylyltransferase [Planctomycetaceae bacterium]
MTTRSELLEKLTPAGQQHLVAFWDELSGAEQQTLAQQILEIDLDVLKQLQAQGQAELQGQASASTDFAALAAKAASPPAIRLAESRDPQKQKAAIAAGEAALRAGEVGFILVAGGLGTRLGFDRPKGMFPLGPISGRPLFQILMDRLLAVQTRYGKVIPLYVMTSPATDQPTKEFFAEHNYFGLDPVNVRFFCQATMWCLDAKWQKILLASKSSLFLGPDGHGGMLSALDKSGCLADAMKRNIKTFFYGQIDNPLLQICDPYLVGAHLLARSEMTTQVVAKRHALERVGNVVSIDGRVQVIEYSDLPDAVAHQTDSQGQLRLWAGNLAVHLMDTSFLNRCVNNADALPFHIARKKVPCLNEQGTITEPESPNAVRFEKFIFDLLPQAQNALVIEADPADAFAPVKNAPHEKTDTAATAQAAMLEQGQTLAIEARLSLLAGARLEINPRFALDASELAQKIPSGTIFAGDTYLGPS